jgi:ubiquinone/menaquinone biosynthesis C-methylase UbiE
VKGENPNMMIESKLVPIAEASLLRSDSCGLTWNSRDEMIAFNITKPDNWIRIDPEMRIWLEAFNSTDARRVADVLHALQSLEHTEPPGPDGPDRQQTLRRIGELIRCGALIPAGMSRSPYTAEMAAAYTKSRLIPPEICALIAEHGQIGQSTRILDLGTGTGDIALGLAEISKQVTGIDVNQHFLDIARKRASVRGLDPVFKFHSANTLVFDAETYDVITAAQMLHWTDTWWSAKGLHRALAANGSVFVVESKPVLPEGHPLRRMQGFGSMDHGGVEGECIRHARQYADQFRAAGRKREAIQFAGGWILRQQRPFDMTFARAYFFDQAVASAFPGKRDPWASLANLFQQRLTENRAHMYWLVARYRKCANSGSHIDSSAVTFGNILDIPGGRDGDQLPGGEW